MVNERTLREIQDRFSFNTDKDNPSHRWQGESYVDIYSKLLPQVHGLPGKVMEIGVLFGGSLQMWSEYFKCGVVGVDIDPTRKQFERPYMGIEIEIGSQSNVEFMQGVANKHGGKFKMILDDGSHVMQHMLVSFNALWPFVLPGGVYIMEDMRLSYYGVDGAWPGMSHNPPQELAPNDRRHFNDFILDKIYKLDHHEGTIRKIEFHPMIVAIHKV